jgi:hypothetical protein
MPTKSFVYCLVSVFSGKCPSKARLAQFCFFKPGDSIEQQKQSFCKAEIAKKQFWHFAG